MTKSKQNILYKAFTWISLISFGMIVFKPLWNYSADTLDASIMFIIGWLSATLASVIKEN